MVPPPQEFWAPGSNRGSSVYNPKFRLQTSTVSGLPHAGQLFLCPPETSPHASGQFLMYSTRWLGGLGLYSGHLQDIMVAEAGDSELQETSDCYPLGAMALLKSLNLGTRLYG